MSNKLKDRYILKNGDKYKLDVESMLFLPINVYWKNIDGIAMGCNDECAQASRANSRYDLVGQVSSDFLPECLAKLIDDVDNDVMESGQKKTLVEYLLAENGSYTAWLSIKQPMYNAEGQVVGLFGTATKIENEILQETRKHVAKLGLDIHDLTFTYALQNPCIEKIIQNLSPRQREYLFHLLHGIQDKVIANIMHISVRTAEHYMNTIKQQLNCRTRTEVIATVLNPNINSLVE